MPELPEVETALRDLEPLLAGHTILEARVLWPKVIAAPGAEPFSARIAGQRFARFERRGKFLIFGLDRGAGSIWQPGDVLIVHQRMTGRLSIDAEPTDAPPPHVHAVLLLDDGSALSYRDPRKFGRLWLVEDAATVVGRLGPEPADPTFSVEWLARKFDGRSAAVKALLLDQSICAGVGNIYADEALFAARIHPARPAGSLTLDEIAALQVAVRDVLARAVGRGGSSLGDASTNYARPGGEAGGFQNEHRVFHRTGRSCFVCGTPIERITVAQRSTHFCPVCQKLTTGGAIPE